MRHLVVASAVLLTLCSSSIAFSHSGHSNRAAWDACNQAALGDGCEWQHDGSAFVGTCRGIGTSLMCVRNQPIRPISESSLTPRTESFPHILLGAGILTPGIVLLGLAVEFGQATNPVFTYLLRRFKFVS